MCREEDGRLGFGMPSALTPLAPCDAARLQTPKAWQDRALATRPRAAPPIRPEFKQRLSCQKLVVDAGAQRCPRDRTHRPLLPATTYIGKPLDYTAAGHQRDDRPLHKKAPVRRGLRPPRPGHLEQRGAAAASAAVRRIAERLGGAAAETGLECTCFRLRAPFHARERPAHSRKTF